MNKIKDAQLKRELPFDLYGRYAIIKDIIELNREGNEKLRILDVGGRGNFLKKFFPKDDVFYLDPLVESDDENFIKGDGCNMPIKSESFDWVTSADVFEHIKNERREDFINENLRVAKLGVILAAPFWSKEIEKAERNADENYQKFSNEKNHKWLKEHIENGLPLEKELEEFLNKKNLFFYKLNNNILFLWEILIGINFFALNNFDIEIKEELENFNYFYNSEFFSYDSVEPSYRKIYFIKKNNLLKNIPEKKKNLDNFLLLELIKKVNNLIAKIDIKNKKLISLKELEIKEINKEIELMKSSKFWKLRNCYLKIAENINSFSIKKIFRQIIYCICLLKKKGILYYFKLALNIIFKNKITNKINKRIKINYPSYGVDYIEEIRSDKINEDFSYKDIKLIAFYLPQFHPIPENDIWWGKGFTEWTNVARSTPQYRGHYQPHIPADLGFYDLRLSKIQEQQANLAKEYGIHGFCYYYYWFNGKKLLNTPIDNMLNNKGVNFPFCVCWANENWTRRWDGRDDQILISQNHNYEDDEKFIRELIPIISDPRYIKVEGKPLLIIYRTELLPDPKRTSEIWKKVAKKAGLNGLFLACVESFKGNFDPKNIGFDALIEFPPLMMNFKNISNYVEVSNPSFEGSVFDYNEAIRQSISRKKRDYLYWRGLMVSWDNTPRKMEKGVSFVNSSPLRFKEWLKHHLDYTSKNISKDKRFIFINAWNEWGEGCHLEPDKMYGHAYLEATRLSLNIKKYDSKG